jgi:hypothetical protein
MANPEDAAIKLLYAADDNTLFTADTVQNGSAFDLVADVEIGEQIFRVIDSIDIFASVRNLTRSTSLALTKHENVAPQNNNHDRRQVRLDVNSGWTANEGDVLQAVATLKVTYGANAHYSHTESDTFVVVS